MEKKYIDYFKKRITNWANDSITFYGMPNGQTQEEYLNRVIDEFAEISIDNIDKERIGDIKYLIKVLGATLTKFLNGKDDTKGMKDTYVKACVDQAVNLTLDKIEYDENVESDEVFQVLYNLSDVVISLDEIHEINIKMADYVQR